jgi:hypothetical protein
LVTDQPDRPHHAKALISLGKSFSGRQEMDKNCGIQPKIANSDRPELEPRRFPVHRKPRRGGNFISV